MERPMRQLVFRPLDGSAPSDRPPGVTEQVVQVNGDPPRIIRSFDLRGADVATDIAYVFGRNVAAARAENERLTGNPDGVLGRG